MSIRTLFRTLGPISPFDEVHSTSDGLHSIGRPIEEDLLSPPNCILSTSNPHVYRLLNNLNFGRDQIESNEGLVILDSLQRESNLPLEPTVPLLAITHIGEEENLEKEVLVNPQRGTPSDSSSSSSDPPTPPSPPNQGVEEPEEMAQPQRLLNIAVFPYFYGRPGDDPDAYVDRFLIVATANELPQAKYITNFPRNLVGNAGEWYATLNPRLENWEGLRDAFLGRFKP